MSDTNVGVASPSELSPNFEALQAALTEFTQLETAEREVQLASLVQRIHSHATPETIPLSPDLQAAAHRAREVKYDLLPDGEQINPWSGAYTVVAMSFAGEILGGDRQVDPLIEQEYGQLYPYAVAKAAIRLHLELAERPEGLNNDRNYEYIRALLPPEVPLFRGDAVVGASSHTTREHGMIIGTTGCSMKYEEEGTYKDRLLPDVIGVTPMDRVNLLAGEADQIFAELTAEFIEYPNIPLELVHEPSFFAHLRRAH